MFDFDFEEFKEELEGLPILEKLEKLKELHDELANVIQEVEETAEEVKEYIMDTNRMYSVPVLERISKSLQSFIDEKHWNEYVTREDGIYSIKIKQYDISMWAQWSDGEWFIILKNNKFIPNNAKRHQYYADLGQRLQLPYQPENDILQADLTEEELQPTLERIFSVLCE